MLNSRKLMRREVKVRAERFRKKPLYLVGINVIGTGSKVNIRYRGKRTRHTERKRKKTRASKMKKRGRHSARIAAASARNIKRTISCAPASSPLAVVLEGVLSPFRGSLRATGMKLSPPWDRARSVRSSDEPKAKTNRETTNRAKRKE